jgi:intracellular septation protein
MDWLRRRFPFNAHQTVNILSEFGPLVMMFIVNALDGIETGTWALIVSTVLAMIVMRIVLGRLPVFPVIASGITIVFGAMTLLTGDPMWIQIKVTIFNALFAMFLFGGLWLRRNFFKYIFQQTFHYTDQGWNRFTLSFAWFFIFTAVLNELVRRVFHDDAIYSLLGFDIDGLNIWILFKVGFIMPLSGIYAWWLTRLMQKYRADQPADADQTLSEEPAASQYAPAGRKAPAA